MKINVIKLGKTLDDYVNLHDTIGWKSDMLFMVKALNTFSNAQLIKEYSPKLLDSDVLLVVFGPLEYVKNNVDIREIILKHNGLKVYINQDLYYKKQEELYNLFDKILVDISENKLLNYSSEVKQPINKFRQSLSMLLKFISLENSFVNELYQRDNSILFGGNEKDRVQELRAALQKYSNLELYGHLKSVGIDKKLEHWDMQKKYKSCKFLLSIPAKRARQFEQNLWNSAFSMAFLIPEIMPNYINNNVYNSEFKELTYNFNKLDFPNYEYLNKNYDDIIYRLLKYRKKIINKKFEIIKEFYKNVIW